MVNKTINLPLEIHQQLGKEENASALISRLLAAHFESEKKKEPEMTPEEARRRIEILKKMKELENQL